MLESFHFIRPWWLIALPVAFALWKLIRRSEDPLRGWRGAVDPHLLKALTVDHEPPSKWRERSLLIAWCVGILSLAGPTWKPEPSPFADNPVPVMLLLQASESMLESDLSPSRMERAHLKVRDFVEARKGEPLGLIAFAGTAHLVLPPTRDTEVVATMASNVSPAIMPEKGGDLAAALRLANEVLADTGGSVVIFADRLTTSPELTAVLQENRLGIHLLGIVYEASPEFAALSELADALGASLTPIAADTSDVEALVRRTARLPVASPEAAEGTRWSESGWWLLPLIALLSLLSFRREESASPFDLESRGEVQP